ncbi:hypothetical protein LCGC14_1702200 [marine sediment metagenome]|uniref:Uncharacterized protein n=1 Tax=marine sediment metagenome TaxID=412755 RepID=A0A0F9HI35_9ZZZZ
MKPLTETQEIFSINGIKYVIEKATEIARSPGRPRNKMARYSLLVRRPQGSKLYHSYLYNDGEVCLPF